MFQTTTCRSCGERIIWVVLPSGKRCPVDAQTYNLATFQPDRVAVYELEQVGRDVVATKLDKDQLLECTQFYVSHFSTCQDRDKWSKS